MKKRLPVAFALEETSSVKREKTGETKGVGRLRFARLTSLDPEGG